MKNSDFVDVCSNESANLLLKWTRANKYTIRLDEDKQLFY